ncbi:MAG: OstA family protein [Stigonema ocellatum SAG 48.90 = DSM 106950]|nr:OstA family protein [Stigonema ocellatum SAG 48.90 = DSM 106950]
MMSCYQLPKFHIGRAALGLMLPAVLVGAMAFPSKVQTATAQTPKDSRPLTIHSDQQEYDAKTQVATARGNVQMSYPARGIQATSAQVQYFSKERRIILSGNVYILQQGGNSIRGDQVTYLIDEGRFVVLPQANKQVESTYIVNDTNPNNQAATPAPGTPALKRSR